MVGGLFCFSPPGALISARVPIQIIISYLHVALNTAFSHLLPPPIFFLILYKFQLRVATAVQQSTSLTVESVNLGFKSNLMVVSSSSLFARIR